MGLFESLPDGPMERSQIEKLEKMDAVQGIYPVYSDLNPDTAYGIAILLNGTLRAWAHSEERDEWVEVATKEIEDPVGGIHVDDYEIVEDFQDQIAEEIGVSSV